MDVFTEGPKSGSSHTKGTPIGSAAPNAFALGRLITPNGVTNHIRYGGDQGIVVIGPNGKGKGTRILIPNLLQNEGSSIVVVDPKGELAAVTAPYRRTLGRVVILNPFGILTDIPGYEDLKGQGFNPLGRLDPKSPNFNALAAQLADAMVSISGNESQPHFPQSGRALLAALIMYATIEAREKNEAPTMARVRELLCQASEERHGGNDFEGVGLPKLALEMMQSEIKGLKNKASQFTDWNREIQGIASTAKIQTESFDDDPIADNMADDSFDFHDIKRDPITVYVILPPEFLERHSKWLRMVLTAAIQAVMRPRRKDEPKVWFILDEFYALGHVEIISTVWALVRGYGVQMMPILQNIGQLKERYPQNWESFLGMAGAVVSFATNEMTTAEWLSKRSGETTRRVSSTSSNSSSNTGYSPTGIQTGISSSTNRSFNQTRTTLITPHKFFGLKTGYMVGTFDGLSNMVPIFAPAYFQIQRCKSRARENPYRPDDLA